MREMKEIAAPYAMQPKKVNSKALVVLGGAVAAAKAAEQAN